MPEPAVVEPPPAPPAVEPRFPGRSRLMLAGGAVGLVALAAVLLTMPTGDLTLVAATAAPVSRVNASPATAAAPAVAAITPPPPTQAATVVAPPAPAPAANGLINASALPRGAALRVDGRATSRRRLTLPAGRHFLVVSVDGFATRTDTLLVMAGQTLRWSPQLQPLRPVRTVATHPATATPPVGPPPAPPAHRGNPDDAACRQAMAGATWRDAYTACGRAAQAGTPAAQRSLALLFQNGNGVRRNDDSAARWFAQAAHGGDSEAAYQLAIGYDRGRGVPRNQGAAFDWYTKAAAAGHVAAQLVMGDAYEKGHLGVAKDKGRALEWYRKAAAQGNKDAANKVHDLER